MAVITGAGNGIGKALALGCAERGAKVFLCDIHEEDVKKVADEISSMGGEAHFMQAYVSLSDECQKIFDRNLEIYGSCDLLIHNAGVSAFGEVTEFVELDMHWVPAVNYFTHAYLMKRFIPLMLG